MPTFECPSKLEIRRRVRFYHYRHSVFPQFTTRSILNKLLSTHFNCPQPANQALQSLRQTRVGVVAIFVGIEEVDCFVVTDELLD